MDVNMYVADYTNRLPKPLNVADRTQYHQLHVYMMLQCLIAGDLEAILLLPVISMRADSCHDNMRYVWLFVLIVFFVGQLYLGDGSSHCSTYAIRWLCLVNCVMWRMRAAGCAGEWVVLMIFGYQELISIELSLWLMREKYYMSYLLVN